jgi:hypothetical protein
MRLNNFIFRWRLARRNRLQEWHTKFLWWPRDVFWQEGDWGYHWLIHVQRRRCYGHWFDQYYTEYRRLERMW